MGLYVSPSKALLESMYLESDERTALSEALGLCEEESEDAKKKRKELASDIFYNKLGSSDPDKKLLVQIIKDRDDFTRNKLRKEIENAPKTWLASKIASFRRLYTKLEAELDQEKDLKRTNLLRRVMRVCIKVIDWIAFRLQKLANHVGNKDDATGNKHVTIYRNREYNGRVRALQKKIGIATTDNFTHKDDHDISYTPPTKN